MTLEILATVDDIIELTYPPGTLDFWLTYMEYRGNPSQSNEKLSELHGIKPNTIQESWKKRGSIPKSVQLTDWALENHLLEPIDEKYAKTKLGITPHTPRYPLLEKLTYLVWVSGSLTEGWGATLAGPKESLAEICDEINPQLNTTFEPLRQPLTEAYELRFKPYGFYLGRLIAPLLGFHGKKAFNLKDIPLVAKRTNASKRLFLNLLNGAKGRRKSKQPSYHLTLPLVNTEETA